MKSGNYLLLLLAAFLIFSNCSNQGNGGALVLQGNVSDAADMQFFLDNIKLSKTQVIAKAPIASDGSFKIEMKEPIEPGIYRMRVGSQRASMFLDGTEKTITLNTEMSKIGAYDFELKGSPEGNMMVENIGKFRRKEINTKDLAKLVENAKDPIAAMQYSIMIPPNGETLGMLKKVVGRMQAKYPESEYTAIFSSEVGNIEKQLARQQSQEVIKVGQPAPDIALPNPGGETMKLSDLKGQVVLLDFWASWCGPCRRANPHVVKTYNKYKNKGFTVFSVSLDRPGQAERWKQAISQDNLAWPYHVSDLKYWNSAPASTYGVRGIPKTFLIDKDGTIASTSVSPYSLDQALEKLL